MLLKNLEPNFSIIVPGGCNARCKFCFWKQEKPCVEYIEILQIILNNLPDNFKSISLTGGEPTISHFLIKILNVIDKRRFPKVVLTTNGMSLYHHIVSNSSSIKKIDYLNISRHHYDEVINNSIFNSKYIVNNVSNNLALKSNILSVKNAGINVNLNAVLTDQLSSREDVLKYIAFAIYNGVNAITFRKQHGDNLEPSSLEKEFSSYPVLKETSCSVCRTKVQTINECKVFWKCSTMEPSKDIDGIYELVFHPSGKLTSDWAGKIIVNPNQIELPKIEKRKEIMDNTVLFGIGHALIVLSKQLKKMGKTLKKLSKEESVEEIKSVVLDKNGLPGKVSKQKNKECDCVKEMTNKLPKKQEFKYDCYTKSGC